MTTQRYHGYYTHAERKPGWYGESKRHSEAARRAHIKKSSFGLLWKEKHAGRVIKVWDATEKDRFLPGIHLEKPNSPYEINKAMEDAINKGFNDIFIHNRKK